MNKEEIGLRIQELRKNKGLTQKQLADKLYVTDKAVSKWERGNNLPDLSIIEPLSKELGISVTELLGLENMESDHVIKEISNISINQKKEMIERLKKHSFILFVIMWVVIILIYSYIQKNIIEIEYDVNSMEEVNKVIYNLSRSICIQDNYFVFFTVILFSILLFFKKIHWILSISVSIYAHYTLIDSIRELYNTGYYLELYFSNTELYDLILKYWQQNLFMILLVGILTVIQIGVIVYRKIKEKKS